MDVALQTGPRRIHGSQDSHAECRVLLEDLFNTAQMLVGAIERRHQANVRELTRRHWLDHEGLRCIEAGIGQRAFVLLGPCS